MEMFITAGKPKKEKINKDVYDKKRAKYEGLFRENLKSD